MKKSKGLLLLVVLLVIAMAVCACAPAKTNDDTPGGADKPTEQAPDTGEARKPLQIAFLTKTLSNPYFVTQKDAIIAAVAEMHPEDKVTPFDCNQDFNRELAIVEDCITQGFDAIIITSIDYEGTSIAVKKAVDAGIPCLLLESTSNMAIADCSVMSDNFQAGYIAMEGLAKAMGGSGKIVTFDNSTNPVARTRAEGRDAYIAEYPGITIVNSQDGADSTFTVDKIYDIMNNFLLSDPDITGVWCFMDPNAQGVAAALKNAGLQDKIFNVGVDGSDECVALILADEMLGTAAQFPKHISKVIIQKMYEIFENGPLDKPHMQVPCLFIDKSNAETDWATWAATQPLKYVDP